MGLALRWRLAGLLTPADRTKEAKYVNHINALRAQAEKLLNNGKSLVQLLLTP